MKSLELIILKTHEIKHLKREVCTIYGRGDHINHVNIFSFLRPQDVLH